MMKQGFKKKEIAGGEQLGEDFLLYKNYFYFPDHPLLLVKGKVFFFHCVNIPEVLHCIRHLRTVDLGVSLYGRIDKLLANI